MRDETIPPMWEHMCKNATELATDVMFDLAEIWLKERTQDLEDPIDDPFKILSDRLDKSKSASEGAANPNLDQDCEGDNAGAVDKNNFSKAKEKKSVSFTSTDSLVNEGGSLGMPKMANLSESRLRQLERIQKLNALKVKEAQHPKKKSAFVTKKILGLYIVLSTVASHLSSHYIPIHENATSYEKLVHRFHEANQLYDGTLNVMDNSVFATDANENYTYSKAMKQDDAVEFIKAMLTEVEAHKSRIHWTMVPRSSLPEGAKTICAIWSFKR